MGRKKIAFENDGGESSNLLRQQFESVEYVHGTKPGYESIKGFADEFLQGEKNIANIRQLGSGILSRYLQQRREIISQYSGVQIHSTDAELFAQQQQWAESLGNVTLQTAGEVTGSTLKKMQSAVWSIQHSDRALRIQEMEKLVEQLENFYNSLNAQDQLNLQAVLAASQLEGAVVNIEGGLLVFSRIRGTLDRLRQLVEEQKYSDYGAFVNMNRELGALGEALTIFCANLSDKEIYDGIVNQTYTNGRFVQTGTAQVKSEHGKSITGTADSVFQHIVTLDGQQLTIQEVLSIKATGKVVGPDGKWAVKGGKPVIQIKSMTEQRAVWSLLETIWGKTTKAKNSLMNTLVWSTAASRSYKMIQTSLVAGYFERFLAGTGGALTNQLGFDQASCLIVNGTPIPIVEILAKVVELFQKEDVTQPLSFVDVNLKADNPWKGDSKPDLTAAAARSDEVIRQIQNTLKLKVSLNGNILYDIAKKYMVPTA